MLLMLITDDHVFFIYVLSHLVLFADLHWLGSHPHLRSIAVCRCHCCAVVLAKQAGSQDVSGSIH